MIFLEVPRALADSLVGQGLCYLWSEDPCIVRLVLSFDNTASDLEEFQSLLLI